MNISVDWLNIVRIVSVLGAIQGFVLFILIFQKRKNKSNYYLSYFLFAFSLFIATYAEPTFELYLRYPYITVLADVLPFFQTPMVYLYFHYTIHKNSRPRIPVVVHMIPAILDIILVHAWYFTSETENFRQILYRSFSASPHPLVWISSVGKYASGILYSFLILRMIYRTLHRDGQRSGQGSNSSLKNRRQRNWLIAGASAHAFCWLLVVITGFVIFNYTMDHLIVKVFILFELLSFTVTMYLISFFAFRYPTLFPEELAREKIAQKLNIDGGKIARLQKQLEDLMALQFHYLDETATLQSTAKKLKIHPNALSYLVNEKYEKNYNEYINDLRLDYFMELALKSIKSESETTILRLAFDSGFASKTTFNRAFKKRFNAAPVEYLENYIHKRA